MTTKKTILLLGGYGFIGTNILVYIDKFLADKYEVIVFDKLPSHFAGLCFNCVVKTYSGDFADSILIDSIFKDNDIDLVIHLVSTTIPNQSFNARYDVESNLIPTLNLCSSMVSHNVKDIVYISSGGAVYGVDDVTKHKESEDVFPISSYGIVKLTIEKYLMQYNFLFGLKPLILRLSNPYGPYHYSAKQGICNVAIAKGLNSETLSVWGNGTSRKDYIYIDDFVEIMFRLLERGIHSQVINIGSEQVVSVNELLGMIKSYLPNLKCVYTDSSRMDVSHFELDTAKLRSYIGDFQFVAIEEGLKRTYDWEKIKDKV